MPAAGVRLVQLSTAEARLIAGCAEIRESLIAFLREERAKLVRATADEREHG